MPPRRKEQDGLEAPLAPIRCPRHRNQVMKRPRIGFRYRDEANAIARELGVHPLPVCRIGRGRITIRFRQAGASSWSEAQRIEQAFQAAAVARSLLAADPRRALRRRATRAVVVIYED